MKVKILKDVRPYNLFLWLRLQAINLIKKQSESPLETTETMKELIKN